MKKDALFTARIINGSGADRGQNCSVELLGLVIYGDYRHGDNLPCLDRGAQVATIAVNDRTSSQVKQTRRWRLLLARLGTCHNTGSQRVEQQMALWASRSVKHALTSPRVKAQNDTMERWLAGEATDEEVTDVILETDREYPEVEVDAAIERAVDAASDVVSFTLAASNAAHRAEGASRASTAAKDAANEAAWDVYTAASDRYTAAHAAAVLTAHISNAADAAVDEYARVATDADRDDVLIDWLDRYLDAWQKVAADEGCLLPENMEAEYVAFVEQLDFLTGATEDETDHITLRARLLRRPRKTRGTLRKMRHGASSGGTIHLS